MNINKTCVIVAEKCRNGFPIAKNSKQIKTGI